MPLRERGKRRHLRRVLRRPIGDKAPRQPNERFRVQRLGMLRLVLEDEAIELLGLAEPPGLVVLDRGEQCLVESYGYFFAGAGLSAGFSRPAA